MPTGVYIRQNKIYLKNLALGHGWNKGIKATEKQKEALNIGRLKASKIGNNHWNWKGGIARYSCLHKWVSKNLGKPMNCESCHSLSKKRYEWANVSGKYKKDLNDWVRLCTSCHRFYDYGKLTLKLQHE